MEKSRVENAIRCALAKLQFSELKPKQEEVVTTFAMGHDVFVALPTGSGKSLCFWILPAMFNALKETSKSIIVVISPLNSLMMDQERSLQQHGVKVAIAWNSDHEKKENIKQGCYEIVFFSPECLLTNTEWRDMLQSPVFHSKLCAIVVDEAHCVKKWGKAFRKEFSNIGEIRSLIPSHVGLMALTATASRSSIKEICTVLCMKKPVIISESPNKPNIKYEVLQKGATPEETLGPFIDEVRQKGTDTDRMLIFCRTYDDVTYIYRLFVSKLGSAALHPPSAPNLVKYRLVGMYTACTHPSVKEAILSAFTNAQSPLRIVVATIAFGMGLDCPNIRRVIHWGMSSDIESYLQETGRGGRDNQPAKALLYYTKCELKAKHVDHDMKQYCSNIETCRRQVLLQNFDCNDMVLCDSDKCICQCCDICYLKCMCRNKDC